jgi:hypothetical protein
LIIRPLAIVQHGGSAKYGSTPAAFVDEAPRREQLAEFAQLIELALQWIDGAKHGFKMASFEEVWDLLTGTATDGTDQ